MVYHFLPVFCTTYCKLRASLQQNTVQRGMAYCFSNIITYRLLSCTALCHSISVTVTAHSHFESGHSTRIMPTVLDLAQGVGIANNTCTMGTQPLPFTRVAVARNETTFIEVSWYAKTSSYSLCGVFRRVLLRVLSRDTDVSLSVLRFLGRFGLTWVFSGGCPSKCGWLSESKFSLPSSCLLVWWSRFCPSVLLSVSVSFLMGLGGGFGSSLHRVVLLHAFNIIR